MNDSLAMGSLTNAIKHKYGRHHNFNYSLKLFIMARP